MPAKQRARRAACESATRARAAPAERPRAPKRAAQERWRGGAGGASDQPRQAVPVPGEWRHQRAVRARRRARARRPSPRASGRAPPRSPSSSGCASGTGGSSQLEAVLGQRQARRNGEASASGWTAEHTSCRKPGSVSSAGPRAAADLAGRSITCTERPLPGQPMAAASPLGPRRRRSRQPSATPRGGAASAAGAF